VFTNASCRISARSLQNLAWLEKAYEERFNRLAYLNVDALWDPIRSDPRFADLLQCVGIPG
jgi:hypothetical protein